MPRRSPTLVHAMNNPCAIVRSVGILGDSWSFLIVREALLGAGTFAQFRDRLGIASDVLSARLATLVEHGVLEKTPYQEPGQRVREAYQLTAAGEDLKVVMIAMQQWGEAHIPLTPGSRVRAVTVSEGERVHVGLLTADGRGVSSPEVAFLRSDTSDDVS